MSLIKVGHEYVRADLVQYIRTKDKTKHNKYPYVISVHFTHGNSMTCNFATEEDRDAAATQLTMYISSPDEIKAKLNIPPQILDALEILIKHGGQKK